MTTKKMARKRPTKYKERHYAGVTMPVESWGICVTDHCYRHRDGIETILGNFVCVHCFDKGLERRGNK